MNYISSDPDNQLKNESLVPELPFLTEIPKTLKAYPNWVCWTYHHRGDKLTRMPASQQGELESIYRQCDKGGYGLGFLLTPDDPITVICIEGYRDDDGEVSPDAEDIVRITNTYNERDDNLGELYVIGICDDFWGIGKERIRIHSDAFIVPIMNQRMGAYPDVAKRHAQFATVARRYCSLSWMEKLDVMQESCDGFTAMNRVLTECLDTPGWLQDAESTDLYDFLYLFWWDEPRLKRKVEDQIDKDNGDFGSRSRAFKSIEAILAKMKAERRTAKGRSSSRDDDTTDFDDGLPTIEHDRSYPTKSTDETIDALIKFDAPIWQRDGALVTIQSASRDPSSPNPNERKKIRVIGVEADYLQELTTQAAHHLVDYRYYKGKTFYRYDTCPMNTVKRIMARPNHDPFPHLSGVVTIPTLRRDGSIITDPGYDPTTTLYYRPAREFPEPKKNPTFDDAIRALESLQEPMADFTFPLDCFKSAAIAAILTVMSRHILQNVPATPISSSTRGTGKGLIFSIITMIGTGEKISPSPYPKNEEEMAKQLLSIGMEGARIVLFDNITRPFGGETLELALTSDFFKSRVLSTNTMSEIKMGTTFFATGNNMRLNGDTLRRSIPIIIESNVESPEERSDFQIKRLREWLTENQPRLAIDALTILQAYMQAGQPSQHLTEYGSFEEWSDLVRSAVVWLGMDDPFLAQKELQQQSDPGYEQLKTLIEAWDAAYPKREHISLKNVILRVKSDYDLYLKQNPTANAAMVDLGLALTAYDLPSNGNIAALNFNRLFQKMPINNGRSRIISGKWMASQDGGKDKGRLYYIDGDKDIKSDSDDSGLSYSANDNSDLPF